MKFLHTRIRVSDIDATISFYEQLGFQLGRKSTSPAGNRLAYLEVPGERHQLELCWSSDYAVSVPEDLMHTRIGVDDIFTYCASLEEAGIDIWPGDWKTSFSNGGLKMAFVTDPDGYEVEILEN